MRRWACLLVLVIGFVPTVVGAAVHPQMFWIVRPECKVQFAFLTEAQADTFWAEQDAVKPDSVANRDGGLGRSLERRYFTSQLSQSTDIDVMLITLIVSSDSSSTIPVPISSTFRYGLDRNNMEIPSYGPLQDIDVYPGEHRYTYLVFPRLTILPTDRFYIYFSPKAKK